jgi:hypothetical protein
MAELITLHIVEYWNHGKKFLHKEVTAFETANQFTIPESEQGKLRVTIKAIGKGADGKAFFWKNWSDTKPSWKDNIGVGRTKLEAQEMLLARLDNRHAYHVGREQYFADLSTRLAQEMTE